MNDGSPAPTSILLHAMVLNPGGGDVLNTDADPNREEVQITPDADGLIRLQVSLPGSPSELNLGVFTDIGTVDGFADLPVPQ
jgi:hypothetical protein